MEREFSAPTESVEQGAAGKQTLTDASQTVVLEGDAAALSSRMAPSALAKRKKKRSLKADWTLYLLMVPAVILTLIYAYGPMFGLVIAFKRFDIARGIFGSPWIGLDNFRYLFSLENFWGVIRNTVEISVMKIIFNFLAPVIVALMLNEVSSTRFKRPIQTLIYLPHFISWVIISGVIIQMFHPQEGIINNVLIKMGILDQGFNFLGDNTAFRFIIIISDVWKNFGYGTIIYMAALTGINPALYEAATIDRANRWQKMWHITIPGIMPVIVLTMTLSIGGILNGGLDQILNLYNKLVYEKNDILDTFVYRIGIKETQYDVSTAVSLVKSVVSSTLLCTTYFIAYKKANYRIF